MAFQFQSGSSKVRRVARAGQLRIPWSPRRPARSSHGREELGRDSVCAREPVSGSRGGERCAGAIAPIQPGFEGTAEGTEGAAGSPPVDRSAAALVGAERRELGPEPLLA